MVLLIEHQQIMQPRQVVKRHTGIQVVLQVITYIMRRQKETFQSVGLHGTRRGQGMIIVQISKMLCYATDILKHKEGRQIRHYPVYREVKPTSRQGQGGHQADVKGKIYVADFFFGTCPTICPKMAQQMLRVYDRFNTDEDFAILSHTIDPEHDTVEYLNGYAAKLGVNDNKTWHFLTGVKEEIYDLGTARGYMVQMREDETADGGYIHQGAFVLIDKEGRVRGFYDGTIPEKVDILMNDIEVLKAEYAE